MNQPNTQDIRERHDLSVHQDEELIELCDRETWVVDMLRAYNECRKHRGILLDRLEAAEEKLAKIDEYLTMCGILRQEPDKFRIQSILESK